MTAEGIVQTVILLVFLLIPLALLAIVIGIPIIIFHVLKSSKPPVIKNEQSKIR